MSITLDKIDSACASIVIKDSGGDELAIDASGKITAIIEDGGGAITVDAVDLDIRDLSASQDNVAISDGTDTLAVNSDGSINVQSFHGGFATYKVSTETVGTTEVELVSTPLSGRLRVLVQNLGGAAIYVKEATGVTTSNGFEIPACSSYVDNLDDGADLFAISGSAGNDIRVVEYAA